MHTLFAVIIISTLVPLRVSAHPCEGLDILGYRVQRVADWQGVFDALRSDTPMPAGEKATCANVVSDEDCESAHGIIVEHDFPPHSHLVAPAPGGGLWLSGALGSVGFGECRMETSYKVKVLSERHLLVTNQIQIHILTTDDDGETLCEENDDLMHEYWLFDRVSGVVLAYLESDKTDADISVVDDVFAALVDGKRIKVPLADITTCAASNERKHGALARQSVDDGRRQTRQKDYAAAIKSFDKAIEHAPYLATAWSGRGYAELLAGNYESAGENFWEALALNQDKRFQATVWFNIGLAAEKNDNPTWALAAFTRANTVKPSRATALKIAAFRNKDK